MFLNSDWSPDYDKKVRALVDRWNRRFESKKKSRWEVRLNGNIYCEECNYIPKINTYEEPPKYCPNCGSLMEDKKK